MRSSSRWLFAGLLLASCVSSGPCGPLAEQLAALGAKGQRPAAPPPIHQGPPDELGSVLEPFRAHAGMPAIAGAVFQGGTLIAIGSSGVRRLGSADQVTDDDEWHLGSDTKAMTATLVGIAVDQGKLRFDETLGEIFGTAAVDERYLPVTLEQLLQHRGGAPGEMPDDIWSQMWDAGTSPAARANAVSSLLVRGPAQAPGNYVYANAGYMIVGRALELTFRDSWEHLIESMLWEPLQMRSCGFGAPRGDEPWGHKLENGALVPIDPLTPRSDNPPSMGPAGTAHCTIRDWGKFLSLHLAGARKEPTPLVSTAVLQRLQTSGGNDYAAGWGVASRGWAGGKTLNHTGSNTLWYATTWIAPAKNLIFVVATNCATPAAQKDIDAAFGPLIKKYIR